MIDKQLKSAYNEICFNLADKKLKIAFDRIEKLIRDNGQLVFLDEWRNLEQTYSYMLKYTVEGIRDPERQKIYRHLIVSVYALADKVYNAVRLKKSPSLEYEKMRALRLSAPVDPQALLHEMEDSFLHGELIALAEEAAVKSESTPDPRKAIQQKMTQLFYHFWLLDEVNDRDQDFLKQFMEHQQLPQPYKAFLVSAIVLSLQRSFSEQKFTFLFDNASSELAEIKQRALVGLLINLHKYDSRLPFYPQIIARLQLLNEEPTFKENLERIILQLIRSRETEEIQRKITNEILPEMIRISPTLKDKIKLDELLDEEAGDDKNPEWEKIFEDSPELLNKMEEFSEMQLEGADVFMGSFAMLKMYPFFNEFAHWFLPFYPENPDIKDVSLQNTETDKRFIEAIYKAPILCNSDKYSFCFSLERLPGENRRFLAEGMSAEMGQFNELKNDEELTNPGQKAGFVSNQYIQDLYRFYKLHPRKNDFEDIFNWRFDFHNQFALGALLKEDEKILRNVAEYYFKKNYYLEAAELFNYLLENAKDGELFQKLGFCLQKTGNFAAALEAYQKAELYDLNKLWNLNKIALCLRNLRQPQKALGYYLEAEKLDPENLKIQLNIGHCYLELEAFDKALQYYFKVEYLAPGNVKVWRPIAWCSFVTGKKEQAEKYYQKLLNDQPGKHDLMNMGHVQWSMGNRKSALEFFKKSIAKENFTEQEFFEIFDEDLHYLLQQGVDKEDVPIMLDQLRYFVEE